MFHHSKEKYIKEFMSDTNHLLQDLTSDPSYQTVPCALCGPEAPYDVLSPSRFNYTGIEPKQLFSARRIPARLHFRIVRCQQCGLIYSNPIYNTSKIKKLYEESEFIDDPFLQKQYENIIHYYELQLKKASSYLKCKDNLLDIGCGNGFFLKAAKKLGFKNVCGVEPGKDAVQKADPDIRPCIINETFHKGLFEKESFDIVCFFHVLDHIIDPGDFLKNIYEILKPGGIVLLMTHNVKFLPAKLLGERNPMFHIEHLYLFDMSTIRKILSKNGFEALYNKDLLGSYTLAHAIKMLPMSGAFKKILLNGLRGKSIADLNIKLMAGDMVTIGKKVRK